MSTREELDALTSRELHDRAVHQAVRRADLGFLWRLLRELPAVDAARGRDDLAQADVSHVSSLIADALASGHGDAAEALRPFYLDYLLTHST